jgi:hypothetical protein
MRRSSGTERQSDPPRQPWMLRPVRSHGALRVWSRITFIACSHRRQIRTTGESGEHNSALVRDETKHRTLVGGTIYYLKEAEAVV